MGNCHQTWVCQSCINISYCILVFNGTVMPMILQISANAGVLRTKPCVQQMLLKDFTLNGCLPREIHFMFKKKSKKENKEAFN